METIMNKAAETGWREKIIKSPPPTAKVAKTKNRKSTRFTNDSLVGQAM
jgi:hypothetical protein